MNKIIISTALIFVFLSQIANASEIISAHCQVRDDGKMLFNGDTEINNILSSRGYKLHHGKYGDEYKVNFDFVRFAKITSKDSLWTEGLCNIRVTPR